MYVCKDKFVFSVLEGKGVSSLFHGLSLVSYFISILVIRHDWALE